MKTLGVTENIRFCNTIFWQPNNFAEGGFQPNLFRTYVTCFIDRFSTTVTNSMTADTGRVSSGLDSY